MKKITLLAALLVATITVAQETFPVDWDQSVGANASFTIQTGDSVLWTWNNGNMHSVTSTGGTETFDSGIITGEGTEFMFTFNTVGTTDYRCDVHTTSMVGTITVEMALSVEEKFQRNITFYPNPMEDHLVIASLYKLTAYEIYDVSGKKVSWGQGEGNFTNLSTSYLNAGVYFVRATLKEGFTTTKKIIKK